MMYLYLEIGRNVVFDLPYQQHSTSADSSRRLFKSSKDLASLLGCNDKESFSVVGFFMSDIIS